MRLRNFWGVGCPIQNLSATPNPRIETDHCELCAASLRIPVSYTGYPRLPIFRPQSYLSAYINLIMYIQYYG
jgi:hypothetical protein